jgi:hypothetical protein
MSNPTYGTTGLIATTLKNYTPKLEDNVFGAKVLLWIIKAAGIARDLGGGTNIVKPLIYAGNSNVGSYEDDDVFATAANTGISAAEFDWKQFYGLVHFTGIELAQNKSSEALLSLMQARLQQVELTMADALNAMLWDDGSGNSGKDLMGLAGIVGSGNPSVGNLGDIDATANAYWRSTQTPATSANTLALADMRTIYNTVSEGNDHPTNIVTTQTGFESYEALLTDQIRYEDTKMGDAGFQNLMFKGAPVAFDDDADVFTGTTGDAPMWYLNSKYLELSKLAGVWFKPSDLLQPTNQDAFYKHLLCYGNLVVTNRKRHGVLYDIHA